ncbi:zinc-dependent peptidase [Flavobacterium taihuense]|uniref:Zinc-dependent peptidase n=1 Tax=Flavobacterium taihuense TaxID=2857508 RepID=A0ABS6XV33_9FLAO|nr:zinc-dependent peptidase [Flavobacterium taihuense]MBW4359734.1 zinc-dependent peptidase [Flavobacterium taihuense]
MDNIILVVFTFGLTFSVVILLFGALFRLLEYCFGLVFDKPFFVHFCLFPKKISHEALLFLNSSFPFYTRLSDKKKIYFEHRIASVLDEYEFVSREGFVITEEIKVQVAATLTMLSFGMREYLCDVFDKIIIYPSVYFSRITMRYHKGEFNPNTRAVVFSWEDFQKGFDVSTDNLNLGIHEFAHVLHYQGLQRNDSSAVLFSRMYNEINEEVSVPSVREQLIQSNYFRIYGFTNQFEFLAVILEHYFETPLEFETRFPNLYKKVSLMLNIKQ